MQSTYSNRRQGEARDEFTTKKTAKLSLKEYSQGGEYNTNTKS